MLICTKLMITTECMGRMMGIKNALISSVKNAAERLVGNVLTGGLIRRTKVRVRKLYLLSVVVIFYVLFLVAVHCGQNAAYKSATSGISKDIASNYTNNDAKSHKQYLEEKNVEFTSANSIYMDNKTIGRILDAVAQYNDTVAASTKVSYECMTYGGKVTSVDMITGASTLEPLRGTTTVIEEKPVYDVLSVEDELVKQLIMTNILVDVDGDGFIYIPRGTQKIEKTVEVDIAVTESAFWEDVSLNRLSVDADSAHFGEDVFYLRWQPVLTLCTMFIQNNVDRYGTYAETDTDGDSYYLSNADLQNIIDVFAFKYSFYDDVTATGKTSVSFSRITNESSGYRLQTSLDGMDVSAAITNGLTSLTVKRVPALAPQHIFNSYLTYSYQYELLTNGYYRLSSRECVLSPQNFLAACNELIEGFDGELFVQLLSDLDDTEDLVAYYDNLIHGQVQTYQTYDPSECPAIGTYVSTVTGFKAWLFHKNGASDSIENSQSGVTLPEYAYEIPKEAIGDAEFVAMFEAAKSCLGTEYVFGGNGGPGISFDCSSFVSYVLRQCGYPVGRETTTSLLAYCTEVPAQDVRPGDIIFFQGTYRKGVSHVGIWLGDNQFIHASSGAGKVVISDYAESDYYKEHFLCYSRLPAKE